MMTIVFMMNKKYIILVTPTKKHTVYIEILYFSFEILPEIKIFQNIISSLDYFLTTHVIIIFFVIIFVVFYSLSILIFLL